MIRNLKENSTNYFELAVAVVRDYAKKLEINLNDSSIHPEWETDDEENQKDCDNQTKVSTCEVVNLIRNA